MDNLIIRSKRSLLGWLGLFVVLLLMGWGTVLLIEKEGADPPSAVRQGIPEPPTSTKNAPYPTTLHLALAGGAVGVPNKQQQRVSFQPKGPTPQRTEPVAQTKEKRAPWNSPPVADTILYEEPLPEAETEKKSRSPRQEHQKGRPNTLGLIIDDLGYDLGLAKAIIALPADITLAILPGVPYARQTAKLGNAAGREILLHQPMEPRGYPRITPGPGALYAHMDTVNLQEILRANLHRLPEAVGINNHMGSRLTENAVAMGAIMTVLAEKSLFFVDSRTTENSVGMRQALADHVPTAARNVFIDNVPEEEAILRQLAELEHLAHQHGGVIGIGHPHRATLAALRRWLPTISQKGIQVLRVSRFIRPDSAQARYPGPRPVPQGERHRAHIMTAAKQTRAVLQDVPTFRTHIVEIPEE